MVYGSTVVNHHDYNYSTQEEKMIEVIMAIALLCQSSSSTREYNEFCQYQLFNCVYKDLGKIDPKQALVQCVDKRLNGR